MSDPKPSEEIVGNSEVSEENIVTEPDEKAIENFTEKLREIPVPTSVAMNNLRTDINDAVARSPLHIECVLEVFRSMYNALENAAISVAEKEASEYTKKIDDLKQECGIK